MAADAEITVELKDKISQKIRDIAGLLEQLDAIDLSSIGAEFSSITSSARTAKEAVKALRDEIASLRSKTIIITVIRKEVSE